jgi:hypothetical protein
MGWCDSAEYNKQALLMEETYRKQDVSNECVGITLINSCVKVVSWNIKG